MKWKEMSTGQKVLTVMALVGITVCLLLSVLVDFSALSIPKALDHALMGLGFLCLAGLQNSRGFRVIYSIFAALYFFRALLGCF